MPAKDLFHDSVKLSLEQAGWTITADPLFLKVDGQKAYVDLAAEKVLAAQRGTERIAVEIKSFTSGSFLDDFHYAVGQYLNYRAVLALREPERVLYLAVPLDTYEAFFQAGIAAISVQTYAIKLLAYNPATQEVLQWIN